MSYCASEGTVNQIAQTIALRVGSVVGNIGQRLNALERACRELATQYGYSCSMDGLDFKSPYETKATLELKCRNTTSTTVCYATYDVGVYLTQLIGFNCIQLGRRECIRSSRLSGSITIALFFALLAATAALPACTTKLSRGACTLRRSPSRPGT